MQNYLSPVIGSFNAQSVLLDFGSKLERMVGNPNALSPEQNMSEEKKLLFQKLTAETQEKIHDTRRKANEERKRWLS